MGEIIPIPTDRATNKEAMNLTFIPNAFPGQRFRARLDWNGVAGEWVVEFEHVSREFRIAKGIATPYRPYSYLPFVVFFFADPSGQEQTITPENLGDEMQLYAVPGPSGQPPEDF